MGAGKKIACIIIFAILISIPSLALYIIIPMLLGTGASLDMILTGVLGAALGIVVGILLAFGGGKVWLGAFLGGLVALLIAVLGLMVGDTLSGFTGGLLVGLSEFITNIAGSLAILVNFIFAPILLLTPIDWILINRSPLADPSMAAPYTMLLLFGLLPFILGGMVAGLLNKGYGKGTMSGTLIGVNMIVGMIMIMGVFVALGNLFGVDVITIFSGLYEGMFGRNMFLYILSGLEATGIAAVFGSLIGALRGPAEED